MRSFLVAAVAVSCLAGCAAQGPAVTPHATVPAQTIVPELSRRAADDELARAVAAVPRRAAKDPISVALLDPVVATDLRRELDPASLRAELVAALADDPLLRITVILDLVGPTGRPPATLAEALAVAAAHDPRPRPDVWLLPRAGRDTPGAATFSLRADLASAWDDARGATSARGPVADRAAIVKQAAEAIRAEIAGRLAAGLPARGRALALAADQARAEAERQQVEVERRRAEDEALERRAGVLPDDDAMTRLRKIYEARQREGAAGR